MDDIYFTDKKGRRNGKENKSSADRFSESGFYEAPPYEPENYDKNKKKSFTVNIPESDYGFSPEESRTPTGRRVSGTPVQRRRVPYTPAEAETNYDIPQEEYRRPPAGSPSRQPKRPPVAPRKKKRKIGGKLFVAFLMLVIVAMIGAFAYGYSVIGEIDYDDSITQNVHVDEGSLLSSPSVTNILIIGSDARDYDGTEGQRSDSMILFSIDKLHKQIKLTSFLRDSYVYIPEVEYEDKLNAAFNYGGPQLTMDTIEYNFGIDIDHYLIINFEIFTELVDLLGGLDIEGITEEEVYYMVNTLKFPDITEGTNHLNGYKALWYCRMRYLDDDFHRTERQRKVIKTIIKKAASTDLLTLMDIVKQIVPNISTDIPKNELLTLAVGAALSFIRYDIVQQQIPAKNTWYDDYDDYGSYIISLNLEQNREVLKNFVFEKYDEALTTTFPATEEDDYYDDDDDYYYDRDYDYRHDYDEY
ncbi:MAG: LytR family transcriptional regulator [Ruminococcaceae bacterium]|nr:LytR family transcriptional regulator [Oscillospiraceae bacterium]